MELNWLCTCALATYHGGPKGPPYTPPQEEDGKMSAIMATRARWLRQVGSCLIALGCRRDLDELRRTAPGEVNRLYEEGRTPASAALELFDVAAADDEDAPYWPDGWDDGEGEDPGALLAYLR